MESNKANSINKDDSINFDNDSNDKKEHEFNLSYILIKIDDNLVKKKYSKIVKEIIKIEKDNKKILSKRENIKSYIYLFEIKIICLCHFIEGKMSEFYIYKKNSLVFNPKSENMASLEKSFEKLKKILEEDMEKLKKYISDKSIITDNMKEHILLSYARAIYLQGKFCKLKRQISDATSFFSIGINILKKFIKKSIESETFSLFAKLLLSLSCILIEDNSYFNACDNLVFSIKFFNKSLFLTIENANGINIDDNFMNKKNEPFINSIKGLILSLFLLGICLEKIDKLDNAFNLYNQSYWLCKKFAKNIDPIFFSIIENISFRINKIKEDKINEIRSKNIEEKRMEKMKAIQEKNLAKAMKLTNISNRGSFNIEKYLKMENRIKKVLDNVETKFGNKNQGKKFLPIIKYLNFEKNKFNFSIDYLVKEKQKLMEKKLKSKNKKNALIKTENNYFNTEYTDKITINNDDNIRIKFNSVEYSEQKRNKIINNKTNNGKKIKNLSFKEKIKNSLFKRNNIKTIHEGKKINTYLYTKTEQSIYPNIKKSNSNSINIRTLSKYSFQSKTPKPYKSDFKTINPNAKNMVLTLFNKYEKNRKERNVLKKTQKGFITKNSFVFSKNFRKSLNYLQKMDKRETIFQKQLLHLRSLEENFDNEIETINEVQNDINKDKAKEDAQYVYLKLKDKIDDKFNENNNNIELKSTDDKSKKIEKILMQKMKLENNLIMGLNELKINELKKLEKNLKEIKHNQTINILSQNSYMNEKKSFDINEEKLITEINLTNKKNNDMLGSLNNDIIRCDERTMKFKEKQKKFSLPFNLKKFKIRGYNY